ncbi:hypothetical protein T05_10221 [Trichinella murrelli]|uniref:Uncharacterized protein n=1 Tax=Trichinella murrelli TaxID=144512 RepID=A0A0V0T9C3_9BILA|nr:hypothetical protein T05_10221 [Trichinella murrelli]
MRLSASGLLLGDGSYGVSGEAGRLSILSFLDLSGRPSVILNGGRNHCKCNFSPSDQMHYSLPPSFDVGDVEVDDENICTFDLLGIAARYPELDRFLSVYASSNNDNLHLTFLLLQNGHQRTVRKTLQIFPTDDFFRTWGT